MNKFYLMLIAISATLTVMGQPTQPIAPVACTANACTTNSTIDVCPPIGSTVVSSHQGGLYNRGNDANHLATGAIWRFRNMATANNITVNAEITIDAVSNAILDAFDDDAAVDQAGNSIAGFFAPRIGPDQNLNGTDRRGYVQFTMKFYKNSTGVNNNTNSDFANSVNLIGINYVHYDIDGNDADNVTIGGAGSWFRETGVAKRISAANPVVLADAQTNLVAYNYTDATIAWTGFAGSACERDGVSKCSQVASSFSFNGSLPSITFRMGYDYNAGGNLGRPIRQYGSRIGCFNFPNQITLPVKLLSFSGSYAGNKATLSWETENEVNFDHYEIERGGNGRDFISVGSVISQSGTSRKDYDYADDLASSSDNILYYRLRMVDIDGRYSYSNVIMIRRDQGSLTGMLLSPNPVISSGAVTIRLNTSRKKNVDIRVIDATGKMVLKQQNQLSEGINSISINNQNRLQPGIYTVQVVGDDGILSSKLSVIR